MKLKALVAALAVAAILPVTALADEATSSDKANGARTCQALKTSLGETAFKTTYGSNADKSNAFGKCVSAWTRAEHQNRDAAMTACKTEQPTATRSALNRCVQAKLKAERTAERAATVNAAKQCKAERTSLGATAFTAKYGTNANAFGKCVAKLAAAK
ncbi:MAG: hypothetical protein ABIR67_06715 [Gaiellaceae bacterium]